MTTFAMLRPDTGATRQDLLAWIDELKEMPKNSAVQSAVRQAETLLRRCRDKKHKEKRIRIEDEF